MNTNIILIGMPGSGKSTIGVLLAKALGFLFVDTDLLVSHRAGKRLQRILDEDGTERFLELENITGSTLSCDWSVVATGGSMVLSENAMENLRRIGRVVYIEVPLKEIERRVRNISTRGIVFSKNESSLSDVYRDRAPLYKKYADITVSVGGDPGAQTIEDAVDLIAKRFSYL